MTATAPVELGEGRRVPADLVVDFDITDPSLASRLRSEATALAARGPLLYTPRNGGHWILTRYQDVAGAMKDPGTWSSLPTTKVVPRGSRQLPTESDPPEHTRYREIIAPLFSSSRMRELEDQIERFVEELVDSFADAGSCEFVSAFASQLPTRVFLALMGWPLDQAAAFTEWTTTSLLGRSEDARREAAEQVRDHFRAVVDRYRSTPSDDYTGAIIAAVDADEHLGDEDLLSIFFLLLVAGLHTVQGGLSFGLVRLAEDADLQAALRGGDRRRVQGFVEEVLRTEGQVAPLRNVTRTVRVADQELLAGDRVILLIASANEDADEFPDPARFDPERSPNRHLAFASGPHRCIGAHLARAEMGVSFRILLERLDGIELEAAPRLHASQVRGVEELRVRFRRRDAGGGPR